ncbi:MULTISPECIES: hypothetical protein [Corallococcus]|uniref:hypothetical protein n=1 Tax=Corallococcus TaxID=83461 RepID=UPI00117D9319|nr:MULTISPECIES: hypothetical protein [Corallococcus]NBD08770.1 hypothetical protein [Corallococcus silvisoli]TSC32728.1 hypothetical protein FOF48_06910 [Corallococcus sp. Z5C101001]
MSTRMMRLLAAGALCVLALTGCGDDKKPDSNPPDDDGNPTEEQTCFKTPADVNNEIINSCPPAGVTQITKNPSLPLNADGTLPSLP